MTFVAISNAFSRSTSSISGIRQTLTGIQEIHATWGFSQHSQFHRLSHPVTRDTLASRAIVPLAKALGTTPVSLQAQAVGRLSQTQRFMSSSTSLQRSFEHILVSCPDPAVQLVRLNRPKALNALCTPLIEELNTALDDAEANDDIAAVVLTGSERAFAGK